ncbi:hypothetical protein [Nocardioides bigeumensis]|uniref:Uncharacterized protein n=1 Tax=Nocardioides bigeumensis TaxID=433657 RepID=A0ABP5JK82_9ACTN
MSAPKYRAALASLALAGAASLTVVAASAPAQAATAPVPVSISKGHVVTMPTTLQPGVTEFTVSTKRKRADFQLVIPAAGYTPQEAARDIEKGLDRGKVKPLKRFEANVTLAGGTAAMADHPGTLVVTLTPGTYWALDVGTTDPAKFLPVTVTGADTGNVMPASAQIKAKSAAKWAGSPKSIPNKGLLTFKNAATQNHFVEMVKLKKGKSLSDFKKWFLSETGPSGPPPVDFNKGLSMGVVSPGLSETVSYKLPKGNYVMLCFWPDASMGGMPHAFMGMIRGIKLK